MRRFLFLAALLAACGDDAGPAASPDADHDGHPEVRDCDDHDPAVFVQRTLFVDADGDGRGVGDATPRCTGATIPAGLTDRGGDCDDADASRYQVHAYAYRDTDGDGFTVAAPGELCAGDELPPGYATVVSGADCDDADASAWTLVDLAEDEDLDGVGAGGFAPLCTDGGVEPGYATSDSDCAPADGAAWQVLTFAFRDEDGDGRTVAAAGELCAGASLPPTYLVEASSSDCNDHDASVGSEQVYFVDADGDGVGALPEVLLCASTAPTGHAATGDDCAPADPAAFVLSPYFYRDGDGDGFTVFASGELCTGGVLPAGYELEAHGNDCADSDAAVFQNLAYSHRDVDGDGFTVSSSGVLCSGAQLPAGYASVGRGNDCADTNPGVHTRLFAYPDLDADGVGSGASVAQCTAGLPLSGFVLITGDCATSDATAWQLRDGFRDADGDGFTLGKADQLCIGAQLPAGHRDTRHGNDCDDADAARHRYAAYYLDGDGDGVGAGTRDVLCLGDAEPPAPFVARGDDVDDANVARVDDPDDELLHLILL